MSDVVDAVKDTYDGIEDSFKEGIDVVEEAGADFLNEALFGDISIIGSPLNLVDSVMGTDYQKGAEITLNPHKRREHEREIADQEAVIAGQKEASGRDKAYRDALEGKDIDSITRSEILKLHSSGGSFSELSTLIASAREGKGIFGIRKISEEKKMMKADRPGRSQLLGRGSVL